MTPQKQLFLHKPTEGVYGDCHRTCIACLLDKKPEEVPNFGVYINDISAWHKAESEYLLSQGLVAVHNAYYSDEPDALEKILASRAVQSPSVYYMLAGRSRTGVNHSVICLNDKIIWDPSLTDSGIIAPCDDGYYWTQFFSPAYLSTN